MGLKNWLWNNNATELFSIRKSDLTYCREQARKAVKNSIALGSAFLFGTEEREGLVKSVKQASSKAGNMAFKPRAQASNSEARERLDMQGLSGPGYYDENGVKTYHLEEE